MSETTREDIVALLAAVAERAGGTLDRYDAEAAGRAWEALLAGRWSLVDQFDRDGRRFLVVRPNDSPLRAAAAALSARETQVVVYASLAYSNKVIALELGVSEATVSQVRRRAARKLGVRSRLELVRMFAAARLDDEGR